MRRRLSALLAGLLLLFCTAVCVLWVRSVFFRQDLIHNPSLVPTNNGTIWNELTLRSDDGVLAIELSVHDQRDQWSVDDPPDQLSFAPIAPQGGWSWISTRINRNYRTPDELWLGVPIGWTKSPIHAQGFYVPPDAPPVIGQHYALYAPHWLIALVLFMTSILIIRAYRRANLRTMRLAQGHCVACGYDLRSTPQKGDPLLERCPECGLGIGFPGTAKDR